MGTPAGLWTGFIQMNESATFQVGLNVVLRRDFYASQSHYVSINKLVVVCCNSARSIAYLHVKELHP